VKIENKKEGLLKCPLCGGVVVVSERGCNTITFVATAIKNVREALGGVHAPVRMMQLHVKRVRNSGMCMLP
jgi:hypothetical protein